MNSIAQGPRTHLKSHFHIWRVFFDPEEILHAKLVSNAFFQLRLFSVIQ